MSKSIKLVIVLCMVVVMLVPSTALAVDKSCYNQTKMEKIFAATLKEDVSKKETFQLNLLSNYIAKVNKKCTVQASEKKAKVSKAASRQVKQNNNKKYETPVIKPVEKPQAAVTKPQTPAEKPQLPAEKPRSPVEKPQLPTEKPQLPAEKPSAPAENNGSTGTNENQVLNLVNKERAAAGLAPLKYNSKLAEVAKAKAADLRDKNYFSHTSPTYGSPFDMMKSFGINYSSAGENIAKGYKTPAAVMDGWMNSPGHKANILNSSFTEIGVGYVTDSTGAGYWVQMFIRP